MGGRSNSGINIGLLIATLFILFLIVLLSCYCVESFGNIDLGITGLFKVPSLDKKSTPNLQKLTTPIYPRMKKPTNPKEETLASNKTQIPKLKQVRFK